jgi:hypothetical protein
MPQPKIAVSPDKKVENKPEEKVEQRLTQEDCYKLGWQSILRAEKDSFPYWQDMFYVQRLDKHQRKNFLFTKFLRNAFEHDDYLQKFASQSAEDAKVAKQIINDLVTQCKEEFERWKEENQRK